MKKNNKLLLILVAIAVIIFPFDPSVLLNRLLGWAGHWSIFVALLIFILLIVDGKDLKTKIKNVKNEIMDGFT